MKSLLSLLSLLTFSISTFCQDDLQKLLDSETGEETNYVSATFKSSRILNGQSIERMPAGQLDARFHHRFGQLNTGAYNLWGLDQANIFFSVEYGFTNWFMAGLGRESSGKDYEGFAKFSILRQSTGKVNMPVSVSWFSSLDISTLKHPEIKGPFYFSNRLNYVHQILIARKFNEDLSIQVMPTYVHRNIVPTALDPNDLWSVGIGGRMKITSRMSINAEYYYIQKPFNNFMSTKLENPLSLGIDLETGGHVFTFIFTNSLSMIEKGFIGETTGRWSKGDIHFGFNISRVFTLTKRK
jgi:hypothetical protein